MGFMGLNNFRESDNASDFHAAIRLKIRSEVRKELENQGNTYNTPGWLNILLVLKEYPDMVKFLDGQTVRTIDNEVAMDFASGKYLKIKGGAALRQLWKNLLKENKLWTR